MTTNLMESPPSRPNPPEMANPTPERGPSIRRRRVRGIAFTATLAFALALILFLSPYQSVGDAHASGVVTPVVSGLSPISGIVGQTITVTATISGGIPISPVVGSFSGYTVFFFPGQTTSDGGLDYDQASVAAPSGCVSDAVCSESTTVTFTHVYSAAGSYDASLTVYDAAGDYRIATVLITINPPTLTVNPVASPSTTSIDHSILFTASTSTLPAQYESDTFAYLWDFGDGNSSWGNSVEHAYDLAGNYVVTVTSFDNRTGAVGRGYLSDISVTDPAPHPVISLETPSSPAATYAEDTNVSFSAALTTDSPSVQPHLRYWWNFGDGALGAGISTSHNYTTAGTYTVTLTAIDPQGVEASTTLAVKIFNPPPTAEVSPPIPSTTHVGSIATFSGASSHDVPSEQPLLNYTWNAGSATVTDMSTSYGVTGRAGFFAPGTDPVGLTVTDDEGLGVGASTSVLVYGSAPNVGITAVNTLVNITVTVLGTAGNTILVGLYSDAELVDSTTIVRTSDPSGDTATLTDVPIQLVDQNSIGLSYEEPGNVAPTGTNPVSVSLSFWGDQSPSCTPAPVCLPQVKTGTMVASSLTGFSVDANAASLGQLVFLHAQVFSPARTSLTTEWVFGDGTTAVSTTPAPSIAEPTMATITMTHRWAAHGMYTFEIETVDPTGLSHLAVMPIEELIDATVTDVAPSVSITGSTNVVQSTSIPLSGSLTSEDLKSRTFVASWAFGDGGTFAQAVIGAAGGNFTTSHIYQYSATTYALIVYGSDGALGLQTANWTFLHVEDPGPVPAFTLPSTVSEWTELALNATPSLAFPGGPSGPAAGLTYAWTIGEGTTSDSLRAAGAETAFEFTRIGTFSVTLTVTDPEGVSRSLSQSITVTDLPITASLPSRTVPVDELEIFEPVGIGASPTDSALLTGSWNWGDGSPDSTGLEAGHSFLALGTYTVTLDLSAAGGSSTYVLTTTVTVVDQPIRVVLPYDDYTIYGENHTSTFTATVLGSAADALSSPGSFTYYWSFGDGSGTFSSTSRSLTSTVGHTYTLSGNPVLSVEVESPSGALAWANATLIAVPNWDGNGLPDEYAATVLGAPLNDPSSGTGLTSFVEYYLIGGIQPDADTDHAGLTDFQEVFGTVTGYVVNPLDPNVAGDGILDGSHEFTDAFSSTDTASFSPGNAGAVYISGVEHPDDLQSVTSITLYYEIASADPGALSMTLINLEDPFAPTSYSLGAPSGAVGNVSLITNTPVGGPVSAVSGLTIDQFQASTTWGLEVSGGTGTIESAQILVSYYTNPNLADPYGSGLTTGQEVSTPVFNCSEPRDANYTDFNGETMTFTPVDYYPYTQQYYKLSVVQGLPYYPSENSSYALGEGCGVANPHAWATYYGDRQFQIAPWDVNAAGDSGLTNGEKAYGASTYDLTADHYLYQNAVASYGTSSPGGDYPYDGLSYTGPLNPTAYSTGTNGAADSQAIAPASGPEVLGFTLDNAETGEISVLDFGADSNSGGVVQIQDNDVSGSPSLYTPSVSGSNNYCGNPVKTCGYDINWFFTYDDSYQLPVNPTDSTFTISLNIYLNYDLSAGSEGGTTITFSNEPGVDQTFNQGGFSGDATVYTLDRVPVTLLNSTGEVQSIPGYGLRWEGDQHFYAFYVDIDDSGSGTPFQSGQNLLLVSRTAFVNSSLNNTFATGDTNALPCLADADPQISTPQSSSTADIIGSVTVTLDSSCAAALLTALTPHNAAGYVIGAYESLSQTQFELLGISGSILQVAPYFPLAGYDSTIGSPPTNFWQALGNIITSIADAIVSVVLAVVDFIVSVADEIGQAIIGAWNAVVSAVETAIQAIVQAFDFILQWIEQQLQDVYNKVKNALETAFGEGIAYVALPFLSVLLGAGSITSADYNSSMQNIFDTFSLSGPILSPLSANVSGQDLSIFLDTAAGVFGLVFAIVALVMYVIDIVSLGTATGATEGASTAVETTVASIAAGGVAALLAAGSAVTSLTTLVPEFGGNDPFSGFFDYLASAAGSVALNITNAILNFLTLLTGLLLKYLTQSIDGNFIVGLAVGFLALICAVLALAISDVLAQLVLSSMALLLAIIGVVVQLYPSTIAADEASQDSIADAAGIALGLAAVGIAIPPLVLAAEGCAKGCS